jgi:hypothetical protein
MNMFMLGVLAGIVVFAVLYSVFMLNKLHAGIILIHQMVENQGKAAQMLFMKVNKIEKVTETTMQSAEAFVDALRESAEQMMNMRPPRLRNEDDLEQFDDLRKTFDDGIRRMEEDDDEDNDSDEGPREDWKK